MSLNAVVQKTEKLYLQNVIVKDIKTLKYLLALEKEYGEIKITDLGSDYIFNSTQHKQAHYGFELLIDIECSNIQLFKLEENKNVIRATLTLDVMTIDNQDVYDVKNIYLTFKPHAVNECYTTLDMIVRKSNCKTLQES